MRPALVALPLVTLLVLAPATAPAAPPAAPPVADVVRELDLLLEAAWKDAGVEPAAPVTDAEWLRRVSLDVEGVIPEPSVVAALLSKPERTDAKTVARRGAHVRGLLRGQGYARTFAARFANLLVGRDRVLDEADQPLALATWLGAQVAGNAPWDQVARGLLDAPEQTGAAAYRARYGGQVEELAGNALRVLQGVQLQCAQCHDHPYHAEWTQVRFWETAALFAPDGGEVRIPGMAVMGKRAAPVTPRLALTGQTPAKGTPPRAAVGALLTARDNPFFARALVNRVWAMFFGAAFQDPDDLTQAPRLPSVLDRLVADVVASGFDLRRLVEVVVSTRAYQTSSAGPAATRRAQEAVFARMRVRTLAPEQLWLSLARASGLEAELAAASGAPGATTEMVEAARGRLAGLRREFYAVFARDGQDEDHAITEALALMNGPLANVRPAESAAFAEVLRLRPADQVAALFLRCLSRPPTKAERDALEGKGGDASDQRAALLADAAWALLNSSEFATNH